MSDLTSPLSLASAGGARRPRPSRWREPSILPGFGLSIGVTLAYLGLIVVLPLTALALRPWELGLSGIWQALTEERVAAALRLSFSLSAYAALVNAPLGLLIAWVLVRYEFPGRRLLDALVDLPFALPTSVAGITLSAIFAPTGWAGGLLEPLGLKVAYAPAGIAVAMAFTSLPFVVRSLQPVIEEIDVAEEEAAYILGASGGQTFARVLAPALWPALASGCTMAFARSLCEYGAVIFIAGNVPMKTEVTTLLTMIRLEEFDYPSAAALAMVLLVSSSVALFLVNALQFWRRKRETRG